MTARHLVTSALPYANGPIHLGHLAGAYLNADTWVRYKRATGAEVLFVCGTDEHGAPILVNAEKEGLDPASYTDRWHAAIRRSFELLDVRFDVFSRTSRPDPHHALTQRVFLALLERGYVFSQEADQLFCDACKRGLPDRFAVGTCPRCEYPEARGDECPRCAAAFDAVDLLDPRCKTCGSPAARRPSTHWYLDLPKLRPLLEPWLATKRAAWRPNVLGEVDKFLRELKPKPITRDLPWGVPVPLPEAKDKVFYVWFDAPLGYVSATIELCRARGLPEDAWRTWWQDAGTRLVHFIGKDNIAFHAVIFPAMLLGSGEPWALPDVPANEFLNLEGRKFSTSGGWFITVDELVERYPPDALRWTLTRSAPETRDAEFTFKDLQTRVNSELLGTFGNLASRVLKFVRSRYDGRIPALGAPLGEPEEAALAALRAGVEGATAELEAFSTRGAAARVLEVGYAANKLIEARQPFKAIKDDPARAATTIHVACRLLEGLAVLLAPFVPSTAARLWAQLGLAGAPSDRRWQDAAAPDDPTDRAVGDLDQHLFQRIEDQQVEAELASLHAKARPPVTETSETAPTPAPAPAAAPAPAPAAAGGAPQAKPTITYEQFAALDLRIARVAAARPLPKADKLLELELELAGGERRTVLSGIRAWYAPEALVGRQVVYLANLAPRKIRGVESSGMVLAANDADGSAVLLLAERSVPDGAPVS